MNANDQLLEYVLTNHYNHICGKEGVGGFNKVQLDGNFAIHLALSLGGYANYKDRASNCVKFIVQASEMM